MNLRVVTLNFWGTEAPIDRRLALAVRQLHALHADVICMQEVRPHAGTTTAHVIADALGMHAHFAKSVDDEGLAMVTKQKLVEWRALPLPDAREHDARILLSGHVETAGGPIWVHTTHLHYRLDDGCARERQVDAIDAAIRACGRDNDSPPQILCGDFNATPDSDEIRFLRGLTTLAGRRTHFQDAWLRVHPHDEGITWSSENELTRPLRSLDIDRRIDYVFVTSRKKDGRGTVRDCRIVLADRDDGVCASDHYGVLAEVQVVASPA